MLSIIAIMLLAAWFLGIGGTYALPVVAIGLFVPGLLRGRRTPASRERQHLGSSQVVSELEGNETPSASAR